MNTPLPIASSVHAAEKPRPWWRKKRVLLPALFLVVAVAAMLVAVLGSSRSQVILYNDTGGELANITIEACGQSDHLAHLDDGESHRFSLKPGAPPSDIALVIDGDAPIRWRDGFMEAQGGYTTFLHVRRGGVVEWDVEISPIRKLLGPLDGP